MKTVILFVDCMIPEGKKTAPENSYKTINFIESRIKMFKPALTINIVPIRKSQDKELLVENNITKLPAILDDKATLIGLDSIKAFINKYINSIRPPKDDEEVLREEQMAEMDMDKYEAGEYDDDEEDEDNIFGKGDPDARKDNIQQKISQFNARRKGRIEETRPSKHGSRKKKPTKSKSKQPQQDPDEPDNVEPHVKKGGADLNMEDWDAETQQLLDKAGN